MAFHFFVSIAPLQEGTSDYRKSRALKLITLGTADNQNRVAEVTLVGSE
jgi:hypothetical protein